MSEDDESTLEELKIDRQLRKPVPVSGHSRIGGGKFDGAIRAIGLSLITAGIVGFVVMVFAINGAISNLTTTTEVLKATQQFQQQQLVDMRQDIREVQGKTFRGVDELDDQTNK